MKDLLSKKQVLYGAIVTMSNLCVVEVLVGCGFDWLWIDMEHAPFSLSEVQAMTRVVKHALVRIPVNSEEWIKRTLDLGVEGIIIPHVNTVEEVKNIVDLSLYPPKGRRSVCMCGASRYGLNSEYTKENRRLIFIQIEHKEGVANIEEIVKVPGLDGIIIGPYDLSGSYGKLGQVEDKEIVAAMDRVLYVCKQQKMPIGIFAKDAPTAKHYAKKGFQLIAVGIDIHFLWTSAKATIEALK